MEEKHQRRCPIPQLAKTLSVSRAYSRKLWEKFRHLVLGEEEEEEEER